MSTYTPRPKTIFTWFSAYAENSAKLFLQSEAPHKRCFLLCSILALSGTAGLSAAAVAVFRTGFAASRRFLIFLKQIGNYNLYRQNHNQQQNLFNKRLLPLRFLRLAAAAVSAAAGGIGTAHTFDALSLFLPNVSRSSAYNHTYHKQNNNVLHRYLPFG